MAATALCGAGEQTDVRRAVAFERYEPMLRAYVAALTGRLASVDDIVQEVFVRALGRVDRVQDAGTVDRFLRGIARLVVHEHIRERRRSLAYVELTAECMAGDDAAFERIGEGEVLLHLREALAGLPLVARRMVELRYHDGFSAAAIGAVLGIRPTAVRVTLLRIRERLRRDLRRAGAVQ